MGIFHCKLKSRRALRRLGLLIQLAALAAPACVDSRAARVSAARLEQALPVPTRNVQRSLVADPERLLSLSAPLARRLALIEVHDDRVWQALRAAAPGLRGAPDFRRSAVVGLIALAGQRVDRRWPIHLQVAQVSDGAALISGSFEGGAYQPNGVMFVEVAEIAAFRRVVAVDVNGTRYFPALRLARPVEPLPLHPIAAGYTQRAGSIWRGLSASRGLCAVDSPAQPLPVE